MRSTTQPPSPVRAPCSETADARRHIAHTDKVTKRCAMCVVWSCERARTGLALGPSRHRTPPHARGALPLGCAGSGRRAAGAAPPTEAACVVQRVDLSYTAAHWTARPVGKHKPLNPTITEHQVGAAGSMQAASTGASGCTASRIMGHGRHGIEQHRVHRHRIRVSHIPSLATSQTAHAGREPWQKCT